MKIMTTMVMTIGLTVLIMAFVGCPTKVTVPPPQPERMYTNIEFFDLFGVVQQIFIDEGYAIMDRDQARGYLRTSWLEYEGDKHGLARWQERRRFEVFLESDRTDMNRIFVMLQFEVEERARVASDWRVKSNVEKASDSQYIRILSKIDSIMGQEGGVK